MTLAERFGVSARKLGLVATLPLWIVGCATVVANEGGSDEEPPPYVDASVGDIIARAYVTTSILPDGRVVLITRDSKVLDVRNLPQLTLPSKIEAGTNTSVNSIAVFAVQGSPIEIRANFGFGAVCFVVDDATGAYLGSCPKEKYR